MDSLQSLLPKVLNRRGLHKQAQASLVTHHAQEWIRRELPAMQNEILVKHLSNGILTIACTNAIAGQECQMLLPALREYLESECDHRGIADIHLIRNT